MGLDHFGPPQRPAGRAKGVDRRDPVAPGPTPLRAGDLDDAALGRNAAGREVLQDVASLRRDDQARLFAWLDGEHRHVISTTMHPLFPLIAAGVFDEALYYRLNVVRMSAHE